jgi:D-alanyl-D-alanine carboxypeptidase
MKLSKIIVVAIAFALLVYGGQKRMEQQVVVNTAPVVATTTPDFFSTLDIKARSAAVLDVQTGKILYSKESESQVPLASLTKIMTAITAYDSTSTETIVTIDPEDSKVESANGLIPGEKWQLGELIRYMLIVSSNDGASAIARTIGQDDKNLFVSMMNENANKLGLSNTFFLNESGLDVGNEVAGGYGSALDVARMLVYVAGRAPEIVNSTTYDKLKFVALDKKSYNAVNTNSYVASMPNAIASKTGTTDLAGGNLAVVFDSGLGRPIAVVVLGSTAEDRFVDVEKLIHATLSYLGSSI